MKELFGFCPECKKWFKYPKNRRLCTKYGYDNDNFFFSCKSCFITRNELWEEQFRAIQN